MTCSAGPRRPSGIGTAPGCASEDQSAGGSLSAGAARLALENGTANGGPKIALPVLHYPPLDLVTATKDKHSPIGAKAVLKPWMGEVFDTAYVPDRAQRTDRLVSPVWGTNADGLDGIAPALIVTAEYDRLRDEAWRYAQKLDAVGALAEYHEVPDVDHGYNIDEQCGRGHPARLRADRRARPPRHRTVTRISLGEVLRETALHLGLPYLNMSGRS